MKKSLFVLGLLFVLQSCWPRVEDDIVSIEYQNYEPVTLERESFEETLELMEVQAVENPGKIYIKDDLLYVNDKNKGFHIYDNSDPSAPKQLAFINVPLSTDLAIRGDVIYTHHAVDLVALRYSIASKKLTILQREKNAFPRLISPDGYHPDSYGLSDDEIVIGYQLKEN